MVAIRLDIEHATNAKFRGNRRAHLACVGIIIVLALTWFFPLLTGDSFSAVPGYESAVYPWAATIHGFSFYPQSDQAALSLPWQAELTGAVESGTIPWWNSESFGGQPLYADGSSALLYPPRLLLAETVSPSTAHNVLSFIQLALAGLFCYWLLADLELSPLAALFGSVAWMFGAFTLGWLQLEVVAPLFAWLPAGLVTMRRSVLRSGRWVVAAAASIAMLFVSTHLLFAAVCFVTICLYGGSIAVALAAGSWRQGHGWWVLAAPAKAAASAVVGVGLAAFVLVPTAHALGSGARQALSYSAITKGLVLPPSDLRYALWPPPLPITAPEMQWGLGFAGTLTAALAVIGLVLRRKGSGLGRGMTIGAILVAIGGPVGFVAYKLIPGMNVFRPYSRLLFVFDLGLAVLGAVGLDAVMRWISGPAAALAEGPSVPPVGKWYSGHAKRWWISRFLAAMVVGVTALQLGSYGREVNAPFLPSTVKLNTPATPLIRVLKSGSGGIPGWPNRVLPASDGPNGGPPMLDGNDSLIFGIQSATGYDSSVPSRTVDLWSVVGGGNPDAVFATKLTGAYKPSFNAATVRYDLLARLGIDRIALTPAAAELPSVIGVLQSIGWKRIYTGIDGAVYAWTGPPTGPTVVFEAEHIGNDSTALKAFTGQGFDYRGVVILDGVGTSSSTSGSATVASARPGVNSAQMAVRSSKPGWLVVPDMWDPGWSATVNGVPRPVLRANFNEQAIAVPAGRSVVLLRYRPVGLTEGLVISGISAMTCMAILFWPLAARARRRCDPRDVHGAIEA